MWPIPSQSNPPTFFSFFSLFAMRMSESNFICEFAINRLAWASVSMASNAIEFILISFHRLKYVSFDWTLAVCYRRWRHVRFYFSCIFSFQFALVVSLCVQHIFSHSIKCNTTCCFIQSSETQEENQNCMKPTNSSLICLLLKSKSKWIKCCEVFPPSSFDIKYSLLRLVRFIFCIHSLFRGSEIQLLYK